MGRPLKIAKNSPMSGIFYDPNNQGTTAQSVPVDIAYPPFAAPTSMDIATVVLPQPPTTLPFTGVVGGAPVLSAPSSSYPVVSCQVNIALPSGSGAGVATGRIIRQKGAHKFLVVDGTTVNDEDMVASASYMILSLGGTNWQQMGAPAGAIAGTIFTCTATVATASTGTALLVGTCVLTDSNTPTVGNMSIAMAVGGDSTEVYISKLTNRFAQDFNGGATGGSANTGEVWNSSQVVNDIEYAANFFTDASTFAKSGAEVATWTSSNGSDQPGQNGTLELAQIEKITS
jgi:hypothetical protein